MTRKTRSSGRHALRRRLLPLAIAGALSAWGTPALANPTGASVAVGSATITINGKTLTIANTPGAVINWQQFSIQKDEITRFLQQNASSAVLNRVTGQNPSAILGQLLSNGRVFLINPSGIVIGKGAVIDVAGFAASTLNISDADWISGRLRFEGTGFEGKIENAGVIKTAEGGHVYLIAPKVENKPDGVIRSPRGEIIIAAGKTVELVNAGTPEVRVEYTAPDNAAVNAGQIVAEGGRIGIYGSLVKNSGRVSASHAVVGKGGKIVFKATRDVELDAGSTLEANGAQGGEISVQADTGSISAQGSIEANGTESGGVITLQAAQAIAVPAGATVSAVGAGGTVDLVAKNAAAAPTEVRVGGKIEAGARVAIDAPQGRAEIASTAVIAAAEVRVTSRIFAGEGSVDASGAQGGRIAIAADSVDWAGTVLAEGTAGDGGAVTVQAADSVVTSTTSIVRVDGAQAGGEVSILAVSAEVLLSGMVSARGLTTGGEISVTAPKVETHGAVLDASGALGGGRIRVGGDYQGNGDMPQAKRSYIDLYTRIRADAEVEGNGGMVVVWSTDATEFAGEASVRGGAIAGDGGLVETSSRGSLWVTGRVDASAPNGKLGTFLLDPTNIVVATGAGAATGAVNEFGDPGATVTISPTTLAGANATVVLQATNDITISDAVDLSGTAGAGFVAQAGNDINVNASITTDGGAIRLEADSPHSGAAYDGSGQVKINAEVNSCAGVAVSSCGAGGNITLIGGGNSTPDGGFNLKADVVAGDGGIDVAVSLGGNLNFFIGAGGNTQLSSKDTGALKTTGALVLGQALTAGPTGLSTSTLDGAIQLTVNSITNDTASPIQLSADSGSSFQLIAGDGGITLARPLTSYQDMVISTTGDLYVNQTLSTSNYDLTITANNVFLGPNGSIDVGEGTLSCLGSGCAALTGVYWIGTSSNLWSDGANWSSGVAPNDSQTVTILDPEGDTVIIDVAAVAKSLTALSPVQIESAGSLDLKTSSTFSGGLALSGTLTIAAAASETSFITVSSSSGALAWNGGTLGTSAGGSGSGAFFLSADSAATLGNALMLNLEYQNAGVTTLSNGTVIGGSGSILNLSLDSITVPGGATATVNVPIASSGSATIDGTLNVGTLSLSGSGVFGGSGNLSVTSHFSGAANLLGTGFANLSLTKSGDFTIGALQAGQSLALTTTHDGNLTIAGALSAPQVTLVAGGTGDVTLDAGSSVSASGSGNAIVIAGDVFTNNVGGGVLSAPSGRWLVYSTSPSGNTFNGLTSGQKAIWGRGYPGAVSEAGDRYVFASPGSITVTTTNASKTYGDVADLSSNYILYGDPVSAATYGNVFDDVELSDVFASGPTISSTGATADAVVGGGAGAGGAYLVSATGSANAGYALTFANDGLLTVTARPITVTGDDTSRVYGDANPTLTYTIAADGVGTSRGLANGDSLSGALATTATLASDVGDYAITQGTLTDANNGNYAITYVDGTLAVTPRPITVTGDDKSRVYGDANPTLTYTIAADGVGTSRGLANGDSLSGALATTATLASDVGDYAITQGTLTDANNGNYSITFNEGTLNVGMRAITLAASITTKIYGEADPVLSVSLQSGSLAGSDALGDVTGTLTRQAGETVAGGPYDILLGSGTRASNYTIAYNADNDAFTITPATLTIVADPQSKAYGAPDPTLSYVASGFQFTDDATLLTGGLARVAGETVAGGPYAITQGTLAADSNYVIDYAGNSLTITPATLTVAADPQSKVYGAADPALSYAASGFQFADDATLLTGGLARVAGETVAGGPYAITQGTLAANSNYAIAYTGDSLTITPATLTYFAVAASRERGDPNPAFNGTVNGFVAGDTLAGATTGTLSFTSPALQTDAEGVYAINGGGLTANNGNYVFVQAPSNATALTITVPVHFSWTAAGSGDWGTGTNWNKGFAPLSGAIVTIPDLAGVQTITYASGSTDLKSLTSYEGLNLTGGALTLGTASGDVSTFHSGALLSLNGAMLGGIGTLNVAQVNIVNGTLSYSGTVNFGALAQSAGTVSVTGNLGVTNGFSQFGGSLDASGTLSLAGPNILVQGVTTAGALSVSTPGSLTVSAGETAASLTSATNATLQIGGNLVVQGGSGEGASATLANGPGTLSALVGGSVIITGGSGPDAYALIQGNPDVGSLANPISIGGTLTITTGSGSGAYARLESTSAETVYLYFPNLAPSDYGYAVDGVTGRIANGPTGIFAGGVPATLGSGGSGVPIGAPPPPGANLVTTYGIVPDPQPLLEDIQATQAEVFFRTDQFANLSSISDGIGAHSSKDEDGFEEKGAPACR